MNGLVDFIVDHQSGAPYIAFGLTILAGLNVPISIDAVMIGCAFLARTLLPEQTLTLFSAMVAGVYLSAWLSYWVGRLIGPHLVTLPLLRRIMTQEKLEKMRLFYERRGLLALIFGRFIPFGIRNCLFMSTGMSKASFGRFIARDALACSLWAGTMFPIFYMLSAHLPRLFSIVRTSNRVTLSLFGVTLIALIWYKKRKRIQNDDQPIQ